MASTQVGACWQVLSLRVRQRPLPEFKAFPWAECFLVCLETEIPDDAWLVKKGGLCLSRVAWGFAHSLLTCYLPVPIPAVLGSKSPSFGLGLGSMVGREMVKWDWSPYFLNSLSAKQLSRAQSLLLSRKPATAHSWAIWEFQNRVGVLCFWLLCFGLGFFGLFPEWFRVLFSFSLSLSLYDTIF